MKKTAIALALGGLIAVPTIAAADTTVYGSLRISENYSKLQFNRDPVTGQTPSDDKGWDVRNQASRLGFRGSEDLGNGLSAIYHYEFGVDAGDGPTIGGANNRLAYAGLKGGWGQVSIGTQWNPYYFAVGGEVDTFNGDFAANGYYTAAGLDNLDSTRSGNQIIYMSPSFGNFNVQLGINTDDDGGETGIDQWQVAGIYDNGPLFLGAAYRQLAEDSTEVGIDKKAAKDAGLCDGTPAQPVVCNANTSKVTQWGLSGRYRFGFGLDLAGSFQRVDADNRLNKWDTYDLVAGYTFGSTRVAASYFKAKNDDGIREDNDGWILGLTHRMSRRTRLWVEYGQTDFDRSGSGFVPEDKFQNFSIGVRHDF